MLQLPYLKNAEYSIFDYKYKALSTASLMWLGEC